MSLSLVKNTTQSTTSPATTIDGEINKLSNRQAMGLGEQYTAMRFDCIENKIEQYRRLPVQKLLSKIQNRNSQLEDRYACGQLLALCGDPRLKTFEPCMRHIPGGNISLGLAPEGIDPITEQYQHLGVIREWIEKETPRFTADISAFSMGVYPVTHKEYRDYLLDSPEGEIPSSWVFGCYPTHLANHPVATISEEAAHAYTVWLSKKTGRQFRLPTEYEWEYAAAGPTGLEFPWGENFEPRYTNTAELGLYQTTPIGIFIEGASPFGLLDMAGNVEEYTSSNYQAYPGGKIIEDDLLKTTKTYKVARGGSCTRFADLARCKRRHGRYSKDIYIMGFRLAEDIICEKPLR